MSGRADALLARYAALALVAIGLVCGGLAAYHARSALTQGDRLLAAPPDSLGYFSYLPALYVDGTLDVGGAYRRLLRHRPEVAEQLAADRTPTGLTFDKYPVGPAVLWSPFYLAAHGAALALAALGLAVVPDGVGGLYQSAVAIGSVVYGTLAFLLVYRTARLLAPRLAAWSATASVWLGANAVHYMTMEPIFAHVPALFLVSLLLYVWVRSGTARADHPAGYWLLMGLGAGLLLAVRKPDALAVAAPVGFGLAAWWRARGSSGRTARPDRPAGQSGRAVASGLAFLLGLALGFAPQLVVQVALYGSPFLDGYAFSPTDRFDWPRPRLWFTLLSTHRGLFVWHPIYLVGLVGLVRLARTEPRVAAGGGLFFLALWLITSAWSSPEQGNAFGGRFFIALLPFLALGLAALLRPGRWARLVYAGAALLVLWNLLFFVQYAAVLVPHDAPLTADDLFGGKLRLLGRLVGAAG